MRRAALLALLAALPLGAGAVAPAKKPDTQGKQGPPPEQQQPQLQQQAPRADQPNAATALNLRVEEIELQGAEPDVLLAASFLEACRIDGDEITALMPRLRDTAAEAQGVLLRVRLGEWSPGVDILPAAPRRRGRQRGSAGAVRAVEETATGQGTRCCPGGRHFSHG